MANWCETPGCDKEAKLQCPTCIKLEIKVRLDGTRQQSVWTITPLVVISFFQGSFFCSQSCFKGSWDLHKALHKLAKSSAGGVSQNSKKPTLTAFNPWPGYMFTGKLRPAEQSPRRIVPDNIQRPDYADHPEGFPLSEQKLRGNTYIRQLDDEEIEGT